MKPVLVLGKAFNPKRPRVVGGVIVLYELLKKELRAQETAFVEIDLNTKNHRLPITTPFFVTCQALVYVPRTRYTILNATANELVIYGLLLTLICKVFGQKLVLRKFAGNFHEYYNSSSTIKRKAIDLILKNSHLVFFETQYLVEYFKHLNPNTTWFPNVRPANKFQRPSNKPFQRKFVFVGHVRDEKGVNLLVKASKILGDRYSFDLYGPIYKPHFSAGFFDQLPQVNYKGVVSPEDIPQLMSQYDVLVLPTFWKGEGYPGVIIEALSVGLPVISTSLPGIAEIVNDHCGILTAPRSLAAFVEAVKTFDEGNYPRYSKAATSRFDLFNSKKVTAGALCNLP